MGFFRLCALRQPPPSHSCNLDGRTDSYTVSLSQRARSGWLNAKPDGINEETPGREGRKEGKGRERPIGSWIRCDHSICSCCFLLLLFLVLSTSASILPSFRLSICPSSRRTATIPVRSFFFFLPCCYAVSTAYSLTLKTCFAYCTP